MSNNYALTLDDLMAVYRVKYFQFGEPGWGPRMRLSFNYFAPDDHYEALVAKLVVPGCEWMDVGCGRDIFPSNPDLARDLSRRCGCVYGVDPDENINENEFLSNAFQGRIEECTTDRQFDLVTMRMVAEHIDQPAKVMSRLRELTKPGGHVLVLTPNKWSPMSLAAAITPFALHNPLKQLLWRSEARDTFPTVYKLNTRKDLAQYFGHHGFVEDHFVYVDDCRVFGRYKSLSFLELTVRRFFGALGVSYPENCLLGLYRRVPSGHTPSPGRASTISGRG